LPSLLLPLEILSCIARSVSFPFSHLRFGFLPKHWCPFFSTYHNFGDVRFHCHHIEQESGGVHFPHLLSDDRQSEHVHFLRFFATAGILAVSLALISSPAMRLLSTRLISPR
jgi:hypothetical protein